MVNDLLWFINWNLFTNHDPPLMVSLVTMTFIRNRNRTVPCISIALTLISRNVWWRFVVLNFTASLECDKPCPEPIECSFGLLQETCPRCECAPDPCVVSVVFINNLKLSNESRFWLLHFYIMLNNGKCFSDVFTSWFSLLRLLYNIVS